MPRISEIRLFPKARIDQGLVKGPSGAQESPSIVPLYLGAVIGVYFVCPSSASRVEHWWGGCPSAEIDAVGTQ